MRYRGVTAGWCKKTVERGRWEAKGVTERSEGTTGGDEGREMQRGQAINTTRRHARRQAMPKARFIRARTKDRRVDFYSENPPTVASLVSNYRNVVALEDILAALSPPFSFLTCQASWSSLQMRFHLLNKPVRHWSWRASRIARKSLRLTLREAHRQIAIDICILYWDNERLLQSLYKLIIFLFKICRL